jgi:hypothetical protein
MKEAKYGLVSASQIESFIGHVFRMTLEQDTPYKYESDTVRMAAGILLHVILSTKYPESEGFASDAGTKLREFVKQYAEIDCHELFKDTD